MIPGVISDQPSLPTNEALRLRPWLLAGLALQCCVAALLCVIQDYWGCVMAILVTAFGYQVWKQDMDVHWVMCYGTIVLTQAIFDVTHLMVRIHHIPEPFFTRYFWLDVALCAAPFVSSYQAAIMAKTYASFVCEEERQLFTGHSALIVPPGYGATQEREREPGEPYHWDSIGRGRTIESPIASAKTVNASPAPSPRMTPSAPTV